MLTPGDRPSAFGRFVEDHSRLLGLWRRAERHVGFRHGIGGWWALNEALLERLRRATAAAGSALVLVHVPYADWRPFAALAYCCAEHGVALIDPVALDPERPDGMYYPPEGHLTPNGHRCLFDRIVAWIARDGPESLR
jgi:hypothetical protein